MRPDMAKVLVERPRPGSRERSVPAKGYTTRVRRMMADGGTPVREGMTAPYGSTRPFNEHLGPLRRYVRSQVGRPWDRVHSEICAHIDRGNVVQKHILTHLSDYVVTDVMLIDGVPCAGPSVRWPRFGEPLHAARWRILCYVCPKTGLLRTVPAHPKRPRPPAPSPPESIRVNDRLQCRFLAGRWELVTLAPLPDDWHRPASPARDVVLDKPVRNLTPEIARETYGDPHVYAAARRVLGKREQRQYPIPIDHIRSPDSR